MPLKFKHIKLTSDPSSTDKYLQLPEVATASLTTAASTNEGGIVYDATSNTVKFSDGSSWANVGAAASLTVDGAFDNGKIIDGATTAGNAFQVGDGTVYMKMYGDATDLYITTSSGDLKIAPAGSDVSITGNLAVSGTFSPTTLTATNGTITTGTVTTLTSTTASITNLTLGSVDGFASSGDSTFTVAATTGNGIYIDGTTVTSGNVLRVEGDATNLSGGYLINATIDGTSKFKVAEDGAITIAGTASGSNAVALTAGDITLTNGNIVLSAGVIDITAGAGDDDCLDLVPIATQAAVDLDLPGAYNLASGAIDIDGSTGSGPVIEIAMSGAYTGDYVSLNMANAVGAKALDITGAGTRTAALVHVTDVPADGAPTFNIDVTPGHANGFVFDVDVAGTSSAPIFDMAFAAAYTGPAVNINMTNAVGAKAIALTGAGTRTAALVHVTDVPANGSPVFDLDVTPGHANGFVFDIDVAGTSSAPLIDVAFAAAYTGDAIQLTMANAVGAKALDIIGSGARTVSLVHLTDTPGASGITMNVDVTPSDNSAIVMDIDVAGTTAAQVIDIAFAAAHTGDAMQINMTNAVAAKAIDVIGAGTRTTSLVQITDTPDHANGVTLDIDVTPGANTTQVIDIDVAGTNSGDVLAIDFGAAYTGDAINVTMTNCGAAAQALVIDGGHAASGNIVAISSSGAFAGGTGRLVSMSSSGNLASATAGAVLNIAETGNAQATSFAVQLSSTNNEALKVTLGKSHFVETISVLESPVFGLGPNYVTAGGVNNAITATLVDSNAANVALAAGLMLNVNCGALTLQAGANTLALNGGAAKAIKKHTNPANDIGTAYVAGSIVPLMYDGTQWQDLSQ